MPSSATTVIWLLLEQAGEQQSHWERVDKKCDGFVWSESSFDPRAPAPNHDYRGGQICLFFLPEDGGSFGNRLPNTIHENGKPEIRVWCHYGRDINPGRLTERWSAYTRLSDEDRDRLFAIAQAPPLPFSRSQPLEWSEEFQGLKQPKQRRESAEGWLEAQRLLNTAWEKASNRVSSHEDVYRLNRALPVTLSARQLHSTFPESPIEGIDVLRRFIKLFERSEFAVASLSLKTEAPAVLYRPWLAVEHSYKEARRIINMIERPHNQQHRSSPLDPASASARSLEIAKSALEKFEQSFAAESTRLSRALSCSPHSLAPLPS